MLATLATQVPANMSAWHAHARTVRTNLFNHRNLVENIMQCMQALPDETKELYADPASVYNFGWSHGVERMANGQPDRHKGSYYANPLVDAPTTDETLMKQYPAYCRPNIWPTQHLPQYQSAFQ